MSSHQGSVKNKVGRKSPTRQGYPDKAQKLKKITIRWFGLCKIGMRPFQSKLLSPLSGLIIGECLLFHQYPCINSSPYPTPLHLAVENILNSGTNQIRQLNEKNLSSTKTLHIMQKFQDAKLIYPQRKLSMVQPCNITYIARWRRSKSWHHAQFCQYCTVG